MTRPLRTFLRETFTSDLLLIRIPQGFQEFIHECRISGTGLINRELREIVTKNVDRIDQVHLISTLRVLEAVRCQPLTIFRQPRSQTATVVIVDFFRLVV